MVNRAAFAIDMMLHPHRDWDPGDYDPRITIYFAVLLVLMTGWIAWRASRAVLGSDQERSLLGYKAGIDAVFWLMALVVSPMVFSYYDQFNPVLQWASSANDPRSLVYGVLPMSQCALLLGALWLLRLAVLRKPASAATRSVLKAMGIYFAAQPERHRPHHLLCRLGSELEHDHHRGLPARALPVSSHHCRLSGAPPAHTTKSPGGFNNLQAKKN